MTTPSTPSARLNTTTELLLVSPETPSASRPSTARKRRITPNQEEVAPRKMAVLTWPEPTLSPLSSLISDALARYWPAGAVQASLNSGLPYGPYQPNPLYSGPAPIRVRHIVASFNLRDRPELINDYEHREFIFKLFPGTLSLSIMMPFLLIGVRHLPPKPWPKSVAGLLPYFFIEHGGSDMGSAHSPIPMGIGIRSTNRAIANELNGRDSQEWTAIFLAVRQDFEQQGVAITEVIYWWTYIIIVLERRNVDHTKLPCRVGKLACRYLFEDEMGRSAPSSARRLTDPTPGQPDESIYPTLQPGLRIASNHIPSRGQQYMATSTGVLVKDRLGDRYMTAAAHGFPAECVTNVYHPNPQGRVIGELVMELDRTDIALVKLGASEEFHNVTFENADTPASVQLGTLIRADTLRTGDPIWLDSPNTGSIEGAVVTSAWLRIPADDEFEHAKLWVKTTWFYMGQDADGTLPDGICGSAILTGKNQTLNVAGFFRYAPQDGAMSGYCYGISADELIDRGYTLAN